MSELVEAYKQIPLITRSLMTGIVVLSFAETFKLVSVYSMLLYPDYIWRLQLWRLVTSCLFMKLGMPMAFQLFFVYNYCRSLETGYFANGGKNTADMAFFAFIMLMVMNAFGMLFGVPILTSGYIITFVYFWSQVNKDTIVSFFFGLRFKAMYLPVVLVLFDLLQGGFSLSSIFGMFAAHVYYFLEEVYPRLPQSGGARIIKMPAVVRQVVEPALTGRPVQQAPTATGRAADPQQEMRHRWGTGRPLGR